MSGMYNFSGNDKPPIILEYAGGLGNQMFQYTFAVYLHRHTNRNILFDITAIKRDLKRDLLISNFNIDSSYFIRSRRMLFSLLGTRIYTSLSFWEKIINKIYPYKNPEEQESFLLIDDDRLARAFFSNITEPNIEDYITHIMSLIQNTPQKPVYVRGYWQYAWFFEQNKKTLFEKNYRLTCIQNLSTLVEKEIVKISSKENSCSWHIRRGDYLEETVSSMLPSLGVDYFKRAISRILEADTQMVFYVFSDDITWCKQYLPTLYADVLREEQLVFTSGDISKNEVEDLMLMNACTHHVLSNSSFSWWGVMLGNMEKQDEEYICIAPKRWFSDNTKNSLISLSSWIRI